MAKYIVETIYWQPKSKLNDEGKMVMGVELGSHMMEFSNPNESNARHEATKFMDDTIRYGLKAKPGGPIVKSTILPSAIMQVGIVDEEKYQELVESQREESGSLVPSDVEMPSTIVDDHVTSD